MKWFLTFRGNSIKVIIVVLFTGLQVWGREPRQMFLLILHKPPACQPRKHKLNL